MRIDNAHIIKSVPVQRATKVLDLPQWVKALGTSCHAWLTKLTADVFAFMGKDFGFQRVEIDFFEVLVCH